MNKSDYDKYYKKGGTYIIPVEIFNELFDELERLSFNYEQALEDLDKKDNIINELEKHLKNEIHNGRSEDNVWLMGCYDEDREILDKLQKLKGNNNGVWVNNLLKVIKENNIEFGSDKE